MTERDASRWDVWADLIRQRFGLHFTPRDFARLERAVETAAGASPVSELLRRFAEGQPDAREALGHALTIRETFFLREPSHFDLVRAKLAATPLARRHLRLWSAGCATGEEAYSLAITAYEALGPSARERVEVLGTDLDVRALERAREGVYAKWSFRGVPDDVRDRWFTREGTRYRVVPAIRGLVRFAPYNLAAPEPPPMHDVDVILCRNVLLYFDAETIVATGARLFGALSDDGWLVPGSSDPLLSPPTGTRPARRPGALVYMRGPAGESTHPATTATPTSTSTSTPTATATPTPTATATSTPTSTPTPTATATSTPTSTATATPDHEIDAGFRHLEAGAAAEALACARRALVLDRRLAAAHVLAASASSALGDVVAAERFLRNARKLLVGEDPATAAPAAKMSVGELLSYCSRFERSLRRADPSSRRGTGGT